MARFGFKMKIGIKIICDLNPIPMKTPKEHHLAMDKLTLIFM
jgi:hypothetical protein